MRLIKIVPVFGFCILADCGHQRVEAASVGDILPQELFFPKPEATRSYIPKHDTVAPGTEIIVSPAGTNQSKEIQNLLYSGRRIFFTKGVYNLGEVLKITNVDNLTLRAEKGVIFRSTNNKIIDVSGYVNGLTITGISFQSTRSSDKEDAEGLIFINAYGSSDVLSNISIRSCVFSNANTHSNGIKLVSEGRNAMISNIDISCNVFRLIGRMGIEFQNHNVQPVAVRYKDFVIADNVFEGVGTIQAAPAPVCVSVSGYSENGKITRNTFNDMRMQSSPMIYYGIENAGTIGLEITGNTFRSSGFGYTGILGSNPTRMAASRSGQPVKSKWIIKDNVMDLRGSSPVAKVRGIEIAYSDEVQISGNRINTDGYALRLISSSNSVITGNHFTTHKADNVVYIFEKSANNKIYGNTISGIKPDLVVFDDASGNKVYNNMLKNRSQVGRYTNRNGSSNTIE